MKIAAIILAILIPMNAWGAVLLQETFDTAIPDGWGIWNPNIVVSSPAQSGNSVQFSWAPLAEQPTGINSAQRWSWTAVDTLYFTCYWRFNSDWRGSGFGFHPHLVYILDAIDTNLSAGTLRVYIETTDSGTDYAIPRMIIGRGESTVFYDANSSYNMASGAWHKIEAYLVNNTVGSSNGILRMWIDGVQVLNVSDATYRTDASVHFGAVAVGPWMSSSGQGPNLSQTMWMDDMEVHDSMPTGTSRRLNNVTGVRVTLH